MFIIISKLMMRQQIVEICKMADFCGKIEDMRGCYGDKGQFCDAEKGRFDQAL